MPPAPLSPPGSSGKHKRIASRGRSSEEQAEVCPIRTMPRNALSAAAVRVVLLPRGGPPRRANQPAGQGPASQSCASVRSSYDENPIRLCARQIRPRPTVGSGDGTQDAQACPPSSSWAMSLCPAHLAGDLAGRQQQQHKQQQRQTRPSTHLEPAYSLVLSRASPTLTNKHEPICAGAGRSG